MTTRRRVFLALKLLAAAVLCFAAVEIGIGMVQASRAPHPWTPPTNNSGIGCTYGAFGFGTEGC